MRDLRRRQKGQSNRYAKVSFQVWGSMQGCSTARKARLASGLGNLAQLPRAKSPKRMEQPRNDAGYMHRVIHFLQLSI